MPSSAFLLAWRDLRALRDPAAWDAWLRRLTVNACYKLAGRKRRRSRIESQVWLVAGRMLLADTIGRQVQWAQLYLAVDDQGRLGTEWRTHSLEDPAHVARPARADAGGQA